MMHETARRTAAPTPTLPLALLALCLAGGAAAADQRAFLDAATHPFDRGAGLVNPSACTGGLRYDDGSFEGGVGFANAVPRGSYVMAFDLPAGYVASSACLCWTRTEFSNGTGVDFDIVFYAANGEDGRPGTLLGRVPARADNVPLFGTEGVAMYRVPLPTLSSPLPQRVYIGAEWQPFVDRQFYLCNDSTPGTPLNEAWSTVNNGLSWDPTSPIRPSYRALGTALFGGVPRPPQPVPLPLAGAGIGVGLLALGLARIRRHARRPTKKTSGSPD